MKIEGQGNGTVRVSFELRHDELLVADCPECGAKLVLAEGAETSEPGQRKIVCPCGTIARISWLPEADAN